MSDTAQRGVPCNYSNATDALESGAGGTSFAAPMWAGIQALINQSAGGAQGNPNPRYYSLAGVEYGASGSSVCNSSLGTGTASNCIFYDVTLGDNDVPCKDVVGYSHTNCYVPSGSIGVLSTSSSSYSPAYVSNTGWDFATGIGTVNVYNLIKNWNGVITATTLAASPNRSVYGQSVTLTATITPSMGSGETGTVSWSANTGCAASTVSSGVATCTTTALPAGADTITATYSGDSNFAGSSATVSSGVTVTPASTSTVVVSATDPSSYGQSVLFAAIITGANGQVRGGNSLRPEVVTGSVTWSANTGCGTTTVSSSGPSSFYATCTTSALPVGTGVVTATYLGDSNHTGSSGSDPQTVNQAANTVTFTTPAPSSAEYGSSFTVAASGLGTGAITYTSDGVVCTNSGATYTMIAGSGTCTVGATQAADTNYQSASASASVTATDANSSVNVTSSQNPSTFGQSVTFTATITSDTGMVRGRNGATNKRSGRPRAISGTVAWSSNTGCGTTSVTTGYPGTATCTTSALPAGTNTITAAYSGDGNHQAATGTLSGGQVVSTATTITLTPTSLSYVNEALNNTSAAKVVTVKNTGTATLDISNISLAVGTNYSISGNTCGPTLAASKTCKVSVKFTPTTLGVLKDTLTFTDNASGSPQTVPLSGTGVVAAALTPASETYANQTVGTTSTPKTLTLTNNQSVALTSISISTTGDFAVSATTCGTSLASKGKCTISVTFKPTTKGTRTGQLIITDSASNSPQTSNLKGTGK